MVDSKEKLDNRVEHSQATGGAPNHPTNNAASQNPSQQAPSGHKLPDNSGESIGKDHALDKQSQ